MVVLGRLITRIPDRLLSLPSIVCLAHHDRLRKDPPLTLLAEPGETSRADCAELAGKASLQRLLSVRWGPIGVSRYCKFAYDDEAAKRLPVDIFIESRKQAPREIILDIDATDIRLHGEQEGRHYSGHHDCYCYTPLYVFCGRDLLAAELHSANKEAATWAVSTVEPIVEQIRES